MAATARYRTDGLKPKPRQALRDLLAAFDAGTRLAAIAVSANSISTNDESG